MTEWIENAILAGCMFEDAEINDGDRVFPRNQPCKLCTCRRGVISCEDQPCNCSTWTGTSGRDMCCPQCDPKWVSWKKEMEWNDNVSRNWTKCFPFHQSCQHQELKNVVFKSGEQWIYQCQTCECLVGVKWTFRSWQFEFSFISTRIVRRIRLLEVRMSSVNLW